MPPPISCRIKMGPYIFCPKWGTPWLNMEEQRFPSKQTKDCGSSLYWPVLVITVHNWSWNRMSQYWQWELTAKHLIGGTRSDGKDVNGDTWEGCHSDILSWMLVNKSYYETVNGEIHWCRRHVWLLKYMHSFCVTLFLRSIYWLFGFCFLIYVCIRTHVSTGTYIIQTQWVAQLLKCSTMIAWMTFLSIGK